MTITTDTDAKLRRLLDFIPPGDHPQGEVLAVFSTVAESLTLQQVELLGEFIDVSRQGGEQRAYDLGKRALLESVTRSMARASIRERPDLTDAELAAETGVDAEVFAAVRETIAEAERYLVGIPREDGTD